MSTNQENQTGSGQQAQDAQKDELLAQWQQWIKIGLDELERLKPELDRAEKLWKGKRYLSSNDRTQESESKDMVRVNGLRLRVKRSVDQIYAKNPKSSATIKKPILIPETDEEGMPVFELNADGTQAMDANGQPVQRMEDVSERRAEIVEAVIDQYFEASGFKYQVKAACTEAWYRHGAWIKIDSEYDEDEQEEIVSQTWHKFSDVISDPKANLTEGRLTHCRFVAVRLRLSKQDAEKKGLDWSALQASDDNKESDPYEADNEIRSVWQMWDKTRQLWGYVSESGPWPSKPQDWPFKVDGLPFAVLCLDTSPGEKWQMPIILQAESIAEEQTDFRDTFYEKIVCRRPFIAFDPAIIDPKKGNLIANRARKAFIPVDGLAGGRKFMESINTEDVTDQEYSLYLANERTLDGFFPITAGDMGQTTKTTATEIDDLAARATGHADAFRDIVDDFLHEIVKKVKQVMEHVIKTEKIIEVVGKDGAKYWAPFDGSILADCDISLEVGSTTRQNQVTKMQLDINAINVASRIAPAQPGGVDAPKLYVDYLKANGKKNADKYLVPPAPPALPAPPAPADMAGAAGSGPTTGMNPAQSVQDQLNPMK